MAEATEQPAASPKRSRSLTTFYVALGVIAALALSGFWFWRTWTVWWFDADEAKRRQAAAAARLGLPVEIAVDLPPSPSSSGAAGGGGVKLELVLVPAGRFQMGSPATEKNRGDDEKQHWVKISRSFYMGKYEVTQEQWEKVMEKNLSSFKGAKNPVEIVSWDECQTFLEKLNRLSPHPRPLPAAGEGAERRGGFRLPTEAEWEWACRAGTRTRFCSGDADESLTDVAWSDANCGNTTHPVGERKSNAWGLHDLHGNVCEWCGDWYGEYEGGGWAPQRDPAGPPTGLYRVLRGGYWDIVPGGCRSARRDWTGPDYRGSGFGLRLVVVPAGP